MDRGLRMSNCLAMAATIALISALSAPGQAFGQVCCESFACFAGLENETGGCVRSCSEGAQCEASLARAAGRICAVGTCNAGTGRCESAVACVESPICCGFTTSGAQCYQTISTCGIVASVPVIGQCGPGGTCTPANSP